MEKFVQQHREELLALDWKDAMQWLDMFEDSREDKIKALQSILHTRE